jgi:hypothetical protein
MRRRLPSFDLPIGAGLNTQFRPEDTAGVTLLTGENVDSFDEFRSLGKVPGSTQKSDTHSSAVLGLWQYEFIDYDRTRTRQVISHAATALNRIDSDLSVNALAMPSGATLNASTMDAVKANERMYFTGAGQTTLNTGGLQWDGTVLRNWGIQAPSTVPTAWNAALAFDDYTQWTDSTDATSSDATASIDGAGSVAVAKDGTASATAAITRAGMTAIDLSGKSENKAYFYIFIPSGVLQKLKTSTACVTLKMGTASFATYGQFEWSVGNLVIGWNILQLDVTAPTSESSFDNTDIIDISFTLTASSSGQTWTGVLFDFAHTNAVGAATLADGGAGAMAAGDYRYRVTYLTELGVESNAGPASASITQAVSKEIDLTAIPVSPDNQVIARLLYRDLDADGVFRFVAQIDDNVTTAATDNVPQASLGTAQPPLAGDSFIDNSPPLRMDAVTKFGNRVWGIDSVTKTILHISDVALPQVFRLIDRLQFEEELTALEVHAAGMLVYGTDTVFLVRGDGISSALRVDKVSSDLGANGFRTVALAKNQHMAVRETQVFLVSNPTDPWLMNGPILDKWQALTTADLSEMVAIHDRSRFRFLFFPKAADEAFVYSYAPSGGQAADGIDPLDLRRGKWYTLNFETDLDVLCAAVVEDAQDTPELWVGGSDGFVYHLNDSAATSWAKGTGTATMTAIIEFAAMGLGAGPDGRGEPRLLEFAANCGSETVFTIDLELLTGPKGATIATTQHTITVPAGDSNGVYPMPAMGDRGGWLKLKITEAGTTETWTIRNVRVYYIDRTRHQGPRAA